MKRTLYLIPVVALWLITIGCTPAEQDARDAAAALGGSIKAAQAKYQASCSAPASVQVSPQVCELINRAVSGQNALITAAETYCGFSPAAPPADPFSQCVPVKNGKVGLVNATINAQQFVLELKGVI